VQLPSSFLNSLEGLPGYDPVLFEAAHLQAAPITSIRINPAKKSDRITALSQDTEESPDFAEQGGG